MRRSLVLMAMTLIVPGSAQLAVEQRRVGRVALRVWLVLIGILLLVGVPCAHPGAPGLIGLRSAPTGRG